MFAKAGILVWLAALAMCEEQETVTIGIKTYTKTLLLKMDARKHMVISNDSFLFMSKRPHGFTLFSMSISTLVVTEVKGLEGVSVRDLAIDSSGVLWVATSKGLYTIDPASSTATFVMGTAYNMGRIAITKTGILYATEFDYYHLYEIRNQTFHKIPGSATYNIAFSEKGDLYFTKCWKTTTVFWRKGGVHGVESTLAELPSKQKIWLMEVDIKSNILYIFTNDDFFYILPESKVVFRVSGLPLKGEKSGFGSDLYGNIYLGIGQEIYKLSPLLNITDVHEAAIATSCTQEKLAEEIYSKVVTMENIMKRLELQMMKFTSVLTKQQAILEDNQRMAKERQERIEKQIEDQRVWVTNQIENQRSKILNDIRHDVDQKYSALESKLSQMNSLLQKGVYSAENKTESMDVFIIHN